MGLLVSVTLILGYVESLLPPLPGIVGAKLGLSNVVLLFSLYTLGTGASFVLMALKVLLSGLLFGGVSAMAYAFAGGACSMLAMVLIKRVKGVSVMGVSMLGAVFHNAGQVALAMWILQTDKLLYYLAVLIVIGLVTGILTGTVAALVMKHLAPAKGGKGS